MNEYVLIEKTELASIADKVRNISGSTEPMSVLDIGANLETEVGSVKEILTTWLANNGTEVPEGTNVAGLADLIAAIEAGGGSAKIATATFTVTEDTSTPFEITHNLGSIPKIAICIREILSTSGFGNESYVSGELLFSYAVNGEKKGRAYKMSGTSYNADSSSAVAQFSHVTNFIGNVEPYLNGSPIGSCTETTAMLKPAYNSNVIFAAGKPYRWILISEGDAV